MRREITPFTLGFFVPKKIGIMKDLRLLIAKIVVEQSTPLYEIGDELISISQLRFVFVKTWPYFESYGIPLIWHCLAGQIGVVPCRVCFTPMKIHPIGKFPNGRWDYKSMECCCIRHGVFHYKR